MNSYIVHWYTVVGGYGYRRGYSVISAADKKGVRPALRRNLNLMKGEGLRITSLEPAPQ
jgi:hypothetical protein